MLNTEDIEHDLFMQELRALSNKLFSTWVLRQSTREELEAAHSDIMTYGTEPMFASMIFDALLEEADRAKRI